MGRAADKTAGKEAQRCREIQKHPAERPYTKVLELRGKEPGERYKGGEYDGAAEGRQWTKLRRAQVPPLLGNCP